jgi:hypothetical protein
LPAQAAGDGADHQSHRQHDSEGHGVLGIADGEGQKRRHEEKIKGQHAEDRRHDGRAPADGGTPST